MRNTTVGRAIFKNTGKYADFENPTVQQRVAEAVARQARFTYLKKDIESGNQAAQDALVQMALMTAANKTEMTQLITTDDGKSYAISHNEAFKRIAAANKNKTLQIEFDGNTVRMSDGEGITISFNQEGGWSGGRRTTRSSTKISADSVRNLNKLKDQPTNESTLQKFLEGQVKFSINPKMIRLSFENFFKKIHFVFALGIYVLYLYVVLALSKLHMMWYDE